MNIDLNQGGVLLAPHQSLGIHDGLGYKVVCDSGVIWITQDQDPRDIILESGESFTLDRGGHALVHAFEASAIAVKAASPNGRPC